MANIKPLQPKSEMNGLEKRYAGQLELLKRSGNIIDWRFNSIRFRIGKGAWYKPDFFIVKPTHFEMHETKGSWKAKGQAAAKVRLKACAELYPWFKWLAVYWDNKFGWRYEEF
jgi:hypothetical protein